MRSRIRIVSPDPAFAESIRSRLERWGASVAVELDFAAIAPSAASHEHVDVVLLDVRRTDDGLLGWLSSLKRAFPALEVILVSQPGRVAVSIEGMRAGASDELSVPFDLSALRRAISAALRRRRKRLAQPRPSLLERLERAMRAATFAQAGEFETAREILAEGDGARSRGPEGTDPE